MFVECFFQYSGICLGTSSECRAAITAITTTTQEPWHRLMTRGTSSTMSTGSTKSPTSMPLVVLNDEVLNVQQLIVQVLQPLLRPRKARVVLHLLVLHYRLADGILNK